MSLHTSNMLIYVKKWSNNHAFSRCQVSSKLSFSFYVFTKPLGEKTAIFSLIEFTILIRGEGWNSIP